MRSLEERFLIRGRPRYPQSDNGPGFASKAVKKWLKRDPLRIAGEWATITIGPIAVWAGRRLLRMQVNAPAL